MNKNLIFGLMLFLCKNAMATNSCFQEAKNKGKQSKVLSVVINEIVDRVINELEDKDFQIQSISKTFSYSFDNNNFNTFKFYSPRKRFGSLVVKDSAGDVSKLYFYPQSKFKVMDINDPPLCQLSVFRNEKLGIQVIKASDGSVLFTFRKSFNLETSLD